MKTYDIVIIGAGTAGLSAAIYACRAGKQVLILEETKPSICLPKFSEYLNPFCLKTERTSFFTESAAMI